MTKRFLALAKAGIEERLTINDNLVNAVIDPVYEHGMKFTGEVIITGSVHNDTDEGTLGAVLQDYLRKYVKFARLIHITFAKETKREPNTYRRTG